MGLWTNLISFSAVPRLQQSSSAQGTPTGGPAKPRRQPTHRKEPHTAAVL